MKFKPPTWQAIRAMNVVLAIICATLAIMSGPTWFSMLNAALAGMSFAMVVSITISVIPMRKAFDGMCTAFRELHDLNLALMENRVQMIVTNGCDDDKEAGETPRLH